MMKRTNFNRTFHQFVSQSMQIILEAFDSVHWQFVLNVLHHMSFPTLFINWIKDCISTPVFSLSLNGQLEGFIKGAKGIRQGDPISPYLFILCMEILSKMLDAAAMAKQISYHPRCKKLHLTHLCFADDLVVFTA